MRSNPFGPPAERGMSIVEATIVLAVASVLTAIMAPAVRSYTLAARQVTAKHDVETIGGAVMRMLTDVGEAWVVQNGAASSGTTSQFAPTHSSAARVDMLVSDGSTPSVYSGVVRGAGTDWDTAVGTTAVQKLEYYLVLNRPSNNASKAYRTGATMTGTGNFDPDGGEGFNSEFAWRGPYLPGPISSDPWGNRYAVNVEFLARTQGTIGSGSAQDVMVISAGDNGLIETKYDNDGVTSSNDVIYVVSGGTR